ncbi:MAG: OsmC family protein [Planctomycetes bacterium]|nr:OsmC family protein [Planctomycetota bacterium]
MDNPAFTVRVSSKPGGRAEVRVRKRGFEVGAPLSFDSAYDGVTAVEQLLGAMGADLVNGLLARAKKRRVEIDSAEATVEATLNNPLMYLDVVGEQGTTAIERVVARVYINTFAQESEIQELWAAMLERSPLVNTLKQAVKLDLSFKIAI